MKFALTKVLSEQPEQPTKKRIMTTSGREGGIGSGKTLMQPDKTWDEIAREGLDKTVAFKGKDLSKVKLERKDGKVYADGIELTTASTKTSTYAADAPTRAEINAANAPKQTQTAPVATPKPSATTPAPSGGGKPLFATPAPSPSPTPVKTAPDVGVPSTITPKEPPTSPMWKPAPNFPSTRITTTSGTGVNKGIAGVDPTSLPPAGQAAMRAAVSTPAAIDSELKKGRNVLDDAQRGKVSDPTTYTPKSKAMASKADQMSAQSGGLLGVLTNMVKGFEYAGKKLPSQEVPANASPSQEMVSGASQEELQAAQNAAPAPANWAANYARRAQAAGDRARAQAARDRDRDRLIRSSQSKFKI